LSEPASTQHRQASIGASTPPATLASSGAMHPTSPRATDSQGFIAPRSPDSITSTSNGSDDDVNAGVKRRRSHEPILGDDLPHRYGGSVRAGVL
jgi:hypothetical protein